jgi:hypothetical protein
MNRYIAIRGYANIDAHADSYPLRFETLGFVEAEDHDGAYTEILRQFDKPKFLFKTEVANDYVAVIDHNI